MTNFLFPLVLRGSQWVQRVHALAAIIYLSLAFLAAAQTPPSPPEAPAIQPKVITQPVTHDTDDPAIWINPSDRTRSLVVGTDKDSDGSLYAFDLAGRIVQRVTGLKRPNNVDVGYGLMLSGVPTDFAIVTEREAQRLRVFRLPGLEPLDQGDLKVFDGDTQRAPMGIAIYQLDAKTGYILVSDQQANLFRIYPREGAPGRTHDHPLLKTVPVAAMESDGSEVSSVSFGPLFPRGLFVAMSTDRTYHFYSWDDLAGSELKHAPARR